MLVRDEKKVFTGASLAGLLVLSACLTAADGLGAGRAAKDASQAAQGAITKPLDGRWSGSAAILTSGGESNTLPIVADFRMDGAILKGSIGPSPEQQFKIAEASDNGKEIVFQAAMPTRLYRFHLERKGEDLLEGDLESEDGKVKGRLRLTRDPSTAKAAEPAKRDQKEPGAVERAALAGAGFLAGDWEGEDWSRGQRSWNSA